MHDLTPRPIVLSTGAGGKPAVQGQERETKGPVTHVRVARQVLATPVVHVAKIITHYSI
jgi:hypothetical protein